MPAYPIVRICTAALVALGLALSACGDDDDGVTPSATDARTSPVATSTAQPATELAGPTRVEVVVTGLDTPWALAFASGGRMFVTERGGLIRVIENGRVRTEPLADLRADVDEAGEGGLLGMALHPGFGANGFLYVYHTYRSGGELWNRVVRLTVRDNAARDPAIVLDGIPGAQIHDGGRIKFGPDGKLYVTTGDASRPQLAQDRGSLAGKILRLNADGSVPADNPFPGSPVYSYGHRNPQGLAWDAGGRLYATEHGPDGDDEVNIIRPGGNYGWPDARGVAGVSGLIDPITDYTPSIAPSGAALYDGDRFPCLRGRLFFATLRGTHLHMLDLSPEGGSAEGSQRLLDGEFGRLRDAVAGPDGFLYVLTNNRDGRGRPVAADDRLLRVSADCR